MKSKIEKFIQDNTKNCSNETRITIGKVSHWEKHPWLTPDHARAAAKIAREETIEKAVFWLQDNIKWYSSDPIGVKALTDNLRQALEEE